MTMQVIASLVSLAGIFTAYFVFLLRPQVAKKLSKSPLAASLQRFWLSGWGFDRLYDLFFVRPYLWLARVNKEDFIDAGYAGIATLNRSVHSLLSLTQTGVIRWYAMGIAMGAVVFLGIVLLLN